MVGFRGLAHLACQPQAYPPTSDRDRSVVTIELPRGARLEATRRIADQAAALLRGAPEVDKIDEEIGSGGDPRFGTPTITLKPTRERTSVEFECAYAPRLEAMAGARLSFRSRSDGRVH